MKSIAFIRQLKRVVGFIVHGIELKRKAQRHTRAHTKIDIGHLSLHSFQFSLSTFIVSILFVCR